MAAKPISQKKFAKLVAATGPLAQPPGALSRMSNLLFTQRGSLQIADGSQFIAGVASRQIEEIAIFANLMSGQYPYLIALTINPLSEGGISGISATPTAGSTNPAGTYSFGIVGVTANGGHSSMATATVTIAPGASFSTLTFAWTGFADAVTYQIWMWRWPALATPPSVFSGVQIATGIASSPYTTSGVLPLTPVTTTPVNDSTLLLEVAISEIDIFSGQAVPVFDFSATNFPTFLPSPSAQVPGSPSFTGFLLPTVQTPYGGVSGVCDNIPQVVQFAGLAILVLGNGYAPQQLDPSLGAAAATITPLNNTFTAAYPTWQAGVDWLTGSTVTDGSGNYYIATQGGVSQTPGPPTWVPAKGDLTADGSVVWTSQGPIVAIVAPRGAAHAVAYAGSLWLANTSPTNTSDGIDGPSCLKMSDSNNPNSWNPVNTAFIGRADGTQITGLQPFTIAALGISPTGSLCVFKEFQTYQIIGVFGSTSFEIQPAQTNLGCLAARSIQFLPGFGVVRWTHLGFAVFDGINDRLISEDIRPYLFGGVDSESDLTPVDPLWFWAARSAQTTSPPMYLCAMPLTGNSGALTRLFCYDMVMKSWTVLDLPSPLTSLNWMQAAEGLPLVLAGTIVGSQGWAMRMQAGDKTWNQSFDGTVGQPVGWSFRSPDVFGEGSSQRLFVEQVTIRGYGNTAMVASIIANLWLDGKNLGAQAIDIVPQGGGNLFEVRIAIFRNGERFHLDVSGNNGGAPGTIDALDWAVVPKSAMARRIIS